VPQRVSIEAFISHRIPTVVAIEQDDSGLGVVAVRERQGERQRLSLGDLPLPSPAPEGAQWIAAYRLWARHGWLPDEGDEA